MSEVSERYAHIADGFGARVGGITPDQWSDPTPCPGWMVRDLVAHVVTTHRSVVSTLDEVEPRETDERADLVAAFADARSMVEAALDDPARSQRTIGGMFGEQTFESLVGRLLSSDTLIHTWDLARATNQDDRLDAHAVAKTSDFLGSIDEAIRRPGGFAPKIPPPENSDAQTRLLSFCGRAV